MATRTASSLQATRAIVSLAALCGVLALASNAGASDATLRTRLDGWSRTIAGDARAVSLAARRRHPRRMATSALRFRADAVKARAAVGAERPSTASGRRAQQLALTALKQYAAAGSRWADSGRARLAGRKSAAQDLAKAAGTYALAGNRLLVAAAKLLR